MADQSSTDSHQTDPVEPANGRQATVIRFGPFIADRASGLLLRDGADVHVPPKALEVLLCLLERPGAVVSKEDLIGRVWAGTAVTDASLTETVRTLRNVLGDDSRLPTYVQTVHRRGYRFIAAIQTDGDKSLEAGVDAAERNLRPAGLFASAGAHMSLGARAYLKILAIFILGGIVGVWGVSLLGWQGKPTPVVAMSPAQTATLFIGASGLPTFPNEVLRYQIGAGGSRTLDLTLTHPSFDQPCCMAFSSSGEMFLVSVGAGVSRFIDPQGTPLFNGRIASSASGVTHWPVFRSGELFIANAAGGNVLRFAFDVIGDAVPNGAIAAGFDSEVRGVQVNPSTGELFITLVLGVDQIRRFVFDAAGNAVPNGSITDGGISNPHDMAFSPWGELFVANHTGNSISRFVFDAAGNASFNGQITGSSLNGPIGLDFSPWGELFVGNFGGGGGVSSWLFDASFKATFNGSFPTPGPVGDVQFAPSPLHVKADSRPGGAPDSTNPAT